jgi:hypothetical protein
MKTRLILPLGAALVAAVAGFLAADQAKCPTLSAGAETATGVNLVTYQNLGQVANGRASNPTVTMHSCIGACLSVLVPCTLGDVNGDGFIDGRDIQYFIRVKYTGVGTPRELCAANCSYAYFVGLLLTP